MNSPLPRPSKCPCFLFYFLDRGVTTDQIRIWFLTATQYCLLILGLKPTLVAVINILIQSNLYWFTDIIKFNPHNNHTLHLRKQMCKEFLRSGVKVLHCFITLESLLRWSAHRTVPVGGFSVVLGSNLPSGVWTSKRAWVSTELGQRPCCMGWGRDACYTASIIIREIFMLLEWALSWRPQRTNPIPLCWGRFSMSNVGWQLLCTPSLLKEEPSAGDQAACQTQLSCQRQSWGVLGHDLSTGCRGVRSMATFPQIHLTGSQRLLKGS